MTLLEELEQAINAGDKEAVSRIQKKILLGGRDTSIDENFIAAIKGKTLHKNIIRLAEDDSEFGFLDYAKLVSSLITHYLIEAQSTGRELTDFPIQDLYVILGGFINDSDTKQAVQDTKDFIKDRYSEFL